MVKNFSKKTISVAGKYRHPKTFGNFSKKSKKGWQFKINGKSLKIFAALIIMGFFIYLFFLSPFFKIKEVFVEGNNHVNAEEIKSRLPKNQNILFFNTGKFEKDLLKDVPEIKQLQVYKGIPNALKIVLYERDSKLVWKSGSNKYLISSQGEVGREITGTEGDGLPLVIDLKSLPVTPGSALCSPNFVAFIINIQTTFFDMVNIRPLNFEVNETTFDVNLKTEAGFYVKLNSLRSSKKQLENLKLVLIEKRQEIHEYVDLRIDGWAYYK